MKLPNMSTGTRVVASFALVLLLMACMSIVSLWRLQAAKETASNLVDDKLAKQQLTSEILGATQLNGLRAVSIARSDSLEVADIFQAQLNAGEKTLAALETRLKALPQNDKEQGLLRTVAERKAAYLKLRDEIFKMKDMGRVQEVADLIDNKLDGVFKAYIAALDQLLDFQTREAHDMAESSATQFAVSRGLLVALGAAALAVGAVLAAALTRSIVGPLKQAAALTEQVAQGDLTVAIEHGRRDEIGQLFDALSHMTERLATTVGLVRDDAVAIDGASREIAQGNLDLSRRTEHQAAALEETASSMEELTSAVRQNGDHARQANQLAVSASTVAQQGGSVVSQVVDTMASINASSSRIVDIIGVIDGIAFQTNILALNAAVEAARAGEQGRGFAVVASEVRTLAQRSAAAAKEIKELIGDSVEKVEVGSKLVEQAGQTMGEIVTSVQRVTDIMAEISTAGDEQSAGIEQINQAVSEMDTVTQQNAALVEEAAAAAEAMKQQADRLEQVVSIFKVDPQPEQRAAPLPRLRPQPARKALAAPARKALNGGSDWEEF